MRNISAVILCGIIAQTVNAVTVTIPEGTQTINEYTLSNRYEVTGVIIPNTVTSIGNRAFEDCLYLTSITIPDSVESIGNNAFTNCEKLKNITISNSVKTIGTGAFTHCTSLTDITIPNSVTTIGNEAFIGCSSLVNVSIPDSVTSMGDFTFIDCISLTTVTLPESLEYFGTNFFKGCTNLTSMTIPKSVTSGDLSFAFDGCTNLKTLIFNCDAFVFGNKTYSFSGVDHLEDVYFNNGMPENLWRFGNSNPVIHDNSPKKRWGKYEYKDSVIEVMQKTTIPLPEEPGKIGQVLMVTQDGYKWVDIPGGYSTAVADSFKLEKGWNLLSLPETELTDSCKEELLKTYTFYQYDNKHLLYILCNEMRPRMSYWIYVKEPSTIHFSVQK